MNEAKILEGLVYFLIAYGFIRLTIYFVKVRIEIYRGE